MKAFKGTQGYSFPAHLWICCLKIAFVFLRLQRKMQEVEGGGDEEMQINRTATRGPVGSQAALPRPLASSDYRKHSDCTSLTPT